MFEFGKTFNMKSVWIWITNLKPYSTFKIKCSNHSNYEPYCHLVILFGFKCLNFKWISSHIETWQNNKLTKHRSLSLFSSVMDLKRDMSWKSRFFRWGVFQIILKPDKTTDWRNTYHCNCFLVSWIWKRDMS